MQNQIVIDALPCVNHADGIVFYAEAIVFYTEGIVLYAGGIVIDAKIKLYYAGLSVDDVKGIVFNALVIVNDTLPL